MKTLKIRITFTEEVLGTAPNNEEIYADFIGSKAPDAKKMSEEIEAVGTEGIIEKSMTVFPRNENDEPIFWDYQIKGFFKDACGSLRKIDGACKQIKAYKKEIDGLIFPEPRQIVIHKPEGAKVMDIDYCQRPLRASTAQGERIALAMSETVPAGCYIDIDITVLKDDLENVIEQCLDYGKLRGIGQWRNSGKGRFIWEYIK